MVRQPEKQKKKTCKCRRWLVLLGIEIRGLEDKGQWEKGMIHLSSLQMLAFYKNKTEYTVLSYCSEIPDSVSPNETHLLSPCISCLALSHLQGFNVVR